MKKARFTQDKIIGILKGHQASATAADLCRRHGISDATFYTWRSKYGGMEVSEARRLKALEEENAKLKQLDTSKNPLVRAGRYDSLYSCLLMGFGDETAGIFRY